MGEIRTYFDPSLFAIEASSKGLRVGFTRHGKIVFSLRVTTLVIARWKLETNDGSVNRPRGESLEE